MGWNNPNVPWSELERALSGRPPLPGRGPLRPVLPLEYPSSQRRERPQIEQQSADVTATRVPYAELHCHSAFSFLDGASTPELLVAEALRLGLDALAITDHDGLYGIVRFAEAAEGTGLRTLYGAELSLGLPEPQMGIADPVGDHLLVLARGQEGYNRLSVQISRAQLDGGEKGRPIYDLDALAGAAQDQWLILTGCRKGRVRRALARGGPDAAATEIRCLMDRFGRQNIVV
jgi:error-prone DNA polymerase